MKKLVVLVLLVAILGVADVLARVYSEQQLEEGVEERVADTGSVDADIASFPFLGRLVLNGEVSAATIELSDVSGRGIPVASLRIEVDGLRFDRSTAFDSQRIEITGVDVVRVVATISRDDLVEEFSALADLGFDAFEGIDITVGSDELVVAGVTVPFGAGDLLPCDASATVVDDRIELACESDTLPRILVDALGSVDLREELGL